MSNRLGRQLAGSGKLQDQNLHSYATIQSQKSVAAFSAGGSTGHEQQIARKQSIRNFEQQNPVLRKAEQLKKLRAEWRAKKLKKIGQESRQTLMMYAK